jgi:hypothetical protein
MGCPHGEPHTSVREVCRLGKSLFAWYSFLTHPLSLANSSFLFSHGGNGICASQNIFPWHKMLLDVSIGRRILASYRHDPSICDLSNRFCPSSRGNWEDLVLDLCGLRSHLNIDEACHLSFHIFDCVGYHTCMERCFSGFCHVHTTSIATQISLRILVGICMSIIRSLCIFVRIPP